MPAARVNSPKEKSHQIFTNTNPTSVTTNYHLFGSPMPGRTYNGTNYRYGFNGQEKDGETYGDGNEYDFGARIYDPRLGRFMSVDPDAPIYPFMTPYCFAANNPIRLVDKKGKGPGDPPNFVVSVVGDWYVFGFLSTEDRKFRNNMKTIAQASTAEIGLVWGLAEDYAVVSDHPMMDSEEKHKAMRTSFRDMTLEVLKHTFPMIGFTKLSKGLNTVGYIVTAYDIYAEQNSPATREEALLKLTMIVAQAELIAQYAPSTDHGYIRVPNTEFKTPEDAKKMLTQIYTTIDNMFSYYDLGNEEDFNMARNIIENTPGLDIRGYFEKYSSGSESGGENIEGAGHSTRYAGGNNQSRRKNFDSEE